MLKGKRIAILAEEGFEDSELMEPLRAMKDGGARVVIVGSGSKQSYKGKRGLATITVDTTADKVNAEDFNAIIIPGGYALIVTTPQDVALLDSRKAINFAKTLKMPIIGILENMSGLICPHCKKKINLLLTKLAILWKNN